MKKNAMLKIAAILMVAVLLTTCAISSTFAKYVTTGESETLKSARVAKWGVVMTTSTNLGTITEYDSSTTETHVIASDDEIILAPGSKRETIATTTISGTSEVAFKVTTAATVTLAGWKVNDVVKFPVEVKVNGNAVTLSDKTDLSKIKTDIENAIATYGQKDVAAGETLSDSVAVNVEFAWPFSADDAVDTALGEQAAAGNDSTISIAIVQTATQVD